MILNRISNAIRKQDWFTVILEFVIVVVGIFVGLQANEWALERQDRKQELAALERLFLESKNAHELLNENLQHTLHMNQMRRNAVQFAVFRRRNDGILPKGRSENRRAVWEGLGFIRGAGRGGCAECVCEGIARPSAGVIR